MRRVVLAVCAAAAFAAAKDNKAAQPAFQTSDRCQACHNGLITPSGQDVSIGFEWRASVMANSSRDPYWRASVRRETIDHAPVAKEIEDECTVCHMPITRYQAKLDGHLGEAFAHFPFRDDKEQGREAADGVSCSVCHQITEQGLGTRESFNGGFVIGPPGADKQRREYGPFVIDPGLQRVMESSTVGYVPAEAAAHIRKSELCATCHTLHTTAFDAAGNKVGTIAEQVPYDEWLNSDYREKQSCQDCHMPTVKEQTAIARVFGIPRDGMKRHAFIGGNFLLQRMLNEHRADLEVEALPNELSSAAEYTLDYLHTQAARVSIENPRTVAGRFEAEVVVQNLAGHKLPSAYPSRRAWLHVTVRDANDKVVFESGAFRPDGSIVGNDNDEAPKRYEPHYRQITSPDQVEIFEDIMCDVKGEVTTGLLHGVRYLKDNRLLPAGFNKANAEKGVAVVGDAFDDANFAGGTARVRYSVPVGSAQGPLRIDAELWYQPIGYRWANNLKAYNDAAEPRRFTGYYDGMAKNSATVLARAAATR